MPSKKTYQFWLTFNNNAERLQLPVNPEELTINNGSQNTTVNISGLGEVTILQDPAAKTFSFSSEFPVQPGPYCEYEDIPDPWETVQLIEKWKASGNPARFIVTGLPLNYAVTIEEFNYRERGGDMGTIYYDIALKEYRFITTRTLTVDNNGNAAVGKQPRPK